MTESQIRDLLRRARGPLSQAAVGSRMGQKQQCVARWEHLGRGIQDTISLTNLLSWAEALGYEVIVRKKGGAL